MNRARQDKLSHALDELLPTLIETYQPERIILFGSVARDTVGEWSDLDLLIVKETAKPFLDRLTEVALLCRAPVGIDYLVYTPDELTEMVERGNPFILQALAEGRVVYERQTDPALA